MSQKSISEEKLWDLINGACERMTVRQARFWDAIGILPEKWQQHPYGDLVDGFWVVAILGRTVIWYNDIEGGFNHSRYSTYGLLGGYFCNQDPLESTLQELMAIVDTGHGIGGQSGPPMPGPHRP